MAADGLHRPVPALPGCSGSLSALTTP